MDVPLADPRGLEHVASVTLSRPEDDKPVQCTRSKFILYYSTSGGMTMAEGPWLPKLDPGSDSIYARIVAALERDVRRGAVGGGARLPPQRSLADHLHVSVGTVTKAYLEAERRGLVRAHVGRGTFVSDAGSARSVGEAARDRVIDLSLNVAPHEATARLLLSTPTAKRNLDLLDGLAYSPAAGTDSHRRAAAAWI